MREQPLLMVSIILSNLLSFILNLINKTRTNVQKKKETL